MRGILTRWLREPLAHFLLGGMLIFVWFVWRGTPVDAESRTITITRAEVAALASGFAGQAARAPTSTELDQMIDDRVREEIYYREALRLGLDIDDPVIRRRLRSKMEFLAASADEGVPPPTGAIDRYFAAHRAQYARDARLSFDQIFVSSAAIAPDGPRSAAIVERLHDMGDNWAALGEPISLPAHMDGAMAADLDARFGPGFATALARAPLHQWAGPVRSGYGWHMVRLMARGGGDIPPLAEVRQQVENDWRAETSDARQRAAWRLLRNAYRVTVER